MAKASGPISARLVATINARYYPVEGIADSYCLDGKFPSKRELRSVNTTLDRESKGSFIALFGYSSDGRSQTSAWREPLKRLAEQVNFDRGDIDNDINDLAETAMDVTGRIRLGEDATREPYFSGVIIRDGEMAAVTIGESMAFVYRHEALYPLTGSLKDLEPTDLYGDHVEGFNDFIAGEAGTIRYSNIAQIEQGDRLVLCNSEVFDTVGQSQMMRHLEDAEDSLDAAGLLLTAAASQMPGTPMQVAVVDVVSFKEDETAATRFSLGRFATQAMEPVVDPVHESKDVDFDRTQRYKKQDMVDMMKEPPAAEKSASFEDEWSEESSIEAERKSPFLFDPPADSAISEESPLFPKYPGLDERQEIASRHQFDDDDDYSDYDEESAPPSHLPVFAYNQEAQRRRKAQSRYDDYGQSDAWDTGGDIDDERAYDPYSDDDYDELGYDRKPHTSTRTRRIAFYAIFIVIIVVSIIALINLLKGGGSSKPSETTTTTQTDPIVIPSVTTTTTPFVEPTTTTTTGTLSDTIYIVKANDTLWSIASNFYGSGTLSQKGLDKLARYNGMSSSSQHIYKGQELKLPPIETLRAMD